MLRILKLLVLVPIAVVILAFAIANRTVVAISFDPFSSAETSGAVVAAPLFVVLFLTLFTGVILGGVATWLTQGVNRRPARRARDEVEHWQDEVRRMRQQSPAIAATPSRALVR